MDGGRLEGGGRLGVDAAVRRVADDMADREGEVAGLRVLLAEQDVELVALREQLSELACAPDSSAGDDSDLRSRFHISKLLFQQKLALADAQEKTRQAEAAQLRLTAIQRQQVRQKGALWAAQLLRRVFAGWEKATVNSSRTLAVDRAARAAREALAERQTRGRKLDRLAELERYIHI
ncbi:hypothetical protein T492DRAFT_420268 [Pavlovales sp. CCMP2436]|nr:hypothetical protein T492DRAFT_420268 [Pavlovales sp. CCMP2436]